MGNMYERIVFLCEQKGIKPGRVCADTGLSRGMMSDLKMGRTKELSGKNAKKVADYFGVTTDYLFGIEVKKAPATVGGRETTFDDFTYAMSEEAKDLPQEKKDMLLQMARFMRQEQEKGRQ